MLGNNSSCVPSVKGSYNYVR